MDCNLYTITASVDDALIIHKGIFAKTEEEAIDFLKKIYCGSLVILSVKNMENSNQIILKGWVARDENGSIFLFACKPRKGFDVFDDFNVEHSGDNLPNPFHTVRGRLPSEAFPAIKWADDEPTEVEVMIKIK